MDIKDLKHEIIKLLSDNFDNKYTLGVNSKIFNQGTPVNCFKVILSGEVEINFTNISGDEIMLGHVEAPILIIPGIEKSFSISTLFTGITKTECTVLEISKSNFKKILETNSILSLKLIDYCDLLTEMLFFNLSSIFLVDKKTAILEVLMKLYNTYGKINTNNEFIIDKKLSNKLLSKYINVAPETISRLIKSLKEENIINVIDGYFKIVDLEYCKNILGCNYCTKNLCKFLY
ncbi:MAG: Crp/Fnr family transcriptional regulator [Clostridium sp.]